MIHQVLPQASGSGCVAVAQQYDTASSGVPFRISSMLQRAYDTTRMTLAEKLLNTCWTPIHDKTLVVVNLIFEVIKVS